MRDAENGKRLQNQEENEFTSEITKKVGEKVSFISLGCKLANFEEIIKKIVFFED